MFKNYETCNGCGCEQGMVDEEICDECGYEVSCCECSDDEWDDE